MHRLMVVPDALLIPKIPPMATSDASTLARDVQATIEDGVKKDEVAIPPA